MKNQMLNIFCALDALDHETKQEILGNIKKSFSDLGCDVDFKHATDHQSAFVTLSECRGINVRLFSTKEGCYSKDVLAFTCSVPEQKYAINIQIIDTNDDSTVVCYNPKIYGRTFCFCVSQLQDKVFVSSLIKIIIKPVSVYISYGNDSCGQGRYILERIALYLELAFPYLRIIHDRNQEYKDDVFKLIEKIQKGEYVVLIINEKYFYSRYSMAECVGVFENATLSEKFKERVYPLLLESGSGILYEKVNRVPVFKRWQKKRDEANLIAKSDPDVAKAVGLYEDIDLYNRIINTSQRLFNDIASLTIINKIKGKDIFNPILDIVWKIHEDMAINSKFRLYNNKPQLEAILKGVACTECSCLFQVSKSSTISYLP